MAFDLNKFDALKNHIDWKLLNAKLPAENRILITIAHFLFSKRTVLDDDLFRRNGNE